MRSPVALFLSFAVLMAAAAPASAGPNGYSYCVAVNQTAKKAFASLVFEREQGPQQASDAKAFVDDKSLAKPGMYDREPPKVGAECNWDATEDAAKARLSRTIEQARANNINFLGLSWAPAK